MNESDRRKGRKLSGSENDLWRGVTRNIAPLSGRKAVASGDEDKIVTTQTQKIPQTTITARAAASPKSKPSPPLAPFDRRTKQRIARGMHEIGARLDLHGYRQDEAHDALLRFLQAARADGVSIALIITGKGTRGGDGERGVLKRAVPIWLGLPEFRDYVVGFDDASLAHGGEGALYVRIRRRRKL